VHTVKQAKYVKDYQIILTFDNDQSKFIDLRNYLEGEIFQPLNDIAYFKKFRIDNDLETLVWDNGADISPDFLFEIGQEIAI
jgi:hypothetical protein